MKKGNYLVYLLILLTIAGCGPTLKEPYYSPRMSCSDKKEIQHQKSVAVLNVDDNRPFLQKVHLPEMVMDTFLIPLSLGTICLFYTRSDLNYHAMKNIDKDIPDFTADCLKGSNVFQNVARVDIPASGMSGKLSELRGQGFDYALLGRISSFKGNFETKVIQKESRDVGPAYIITKTHKILESYGTVDTEWLLVDLKSGDEIWKKTYHETVDGKPNKMEFRRVIKNSLASLALGATINHVVGDLKVLTIKP